MRNPHNRRRGQVVRRVRSCHGSDCPGDYTHGLKGHRCIILTRIDYRDGRRSECWLSGDYAETIGKACRRRWAEEDGAPEEYAEWAERTSERLQRKRFTGSPAKPTFYGGGFWERVQIDPLPAGYWAEAEAGEEPRAEQPGQAEPAA